MGLAEISGACISSCSWDMGQITELVAMLSWQLHYSFAGLRSKNARASESRLNLMAGFPTPTNVWIEMTRIVMNRL